jgi:uncharacterized repeat protein (TIGR01451 family)
VFVRAGTLTLVGTTFTNNTATGGAAGTGGSTLATAGQGKGGAVFVNTGATARSVGAPTFGGNAAADDANVATDNDDLFGILAVLFPASVSGTKTVAGTFAPGGTVTYTVTLTNAGPGPQQDNPGSEFTDVLPPQLTLVSATATSGTAVATVATNTVTFDGAIPAGGSVTLTITATVNPAAGGATVSNQGSIAFDGDGNGTNDSTALTDDPGTAAPGDPTAFAVAPPPTVSLSATPARAGEAGGTATVTATLSAPSLVDVTVTLGTSGTAAAGADFTLSSPTILIPAGSLIGTATLTGLADEVIEGDETAVVSITAAANATPAGGPVAVTLADETELRLTAVGAGPGGGPAVKVFNPDGTERFSLLAYAPGFAGGVRVATADVTGDGVDDLVTGAGPGGASHVKVFDGATGAELRSFFAYDPGARYGVFVAAADLDGDGVAELITGAGEGGSPHVKVFRFAGLAETASFFAFDPSGRGGVSVAAQAGLLIAGSGVGSASEVRVFAAGAFNQILAFRPFGGFAGGVTVTADNGLIGVGAGPGGGPQVAVYTAAGAEVVSFFAFDPSFTGGVTVGSRGGDDPRLIVGAGPGAAPRVVEYDLTQQVTASYLAFDVGFPGGVFVG